MYKLPNNKVCKIRKMSKKIKTRKEKSKHKRDVGKQHKIRWEKLMDMVTINLNGVNTLMKINIFTLDKKRYQLYIV